MRYWYPHPGNEDEFEDFCVRFYRQFLKRSTLVRYAKRGEPQDGIDIIDQLGLKPFIVVQCKCHSPTKTLPPKEIRNEVRLAEASCHPIEHYIIATTAKKSRTAQDAVVKLNQRNADSRPFTVEIHFWEDIVTYLGEFGRAIAEFIVWGERSAEDTVESVPHATVDYASATGREATTTELYSEIFTLFVERKLEAAEHEINKLPDPERDSTLSAEERYAILRLRAKLALEHCQFDESARLFTLAYETRPDLQQARQNNMLALELSGQRPLAFTEAVNLITEGARSPFLVSLLIRTAAALVDLSQYRNLIDEYTPSSEEVNLALVDRYLAWNEPAFAEAAAKRVIAIAPDSAHAFFSRGMVAHHLGVQGEWQARFGRLADAIQNYSKAIELAERDKFLGMLPEIYFNRGRVQAVSGHSAEAAQDIRSAMRVASNQSLYAEGAVSFFLHAQDYESAWEFVPLLDATSDESAFLTLVTEYHHARNDERRGLVQAMAAFAERNGARAIEARFQCVQWAIDLKDCSLAQQCVPSSFIDTYPFQGNTLLGWIALEAPDAERAREHAALALDSTSRAANPQEISVLARLLVRLGEDEKALPLLERVSTRGILDDDCRQLIQYAQRLGRHDMLLRICDDLRHTNQHDTLTRRLEVELLSHYAPDQALTLAREFVQYEKAYFSAVTNYLAVRLGKREQVALDEQNLPNPNDFEPDEAYLIVTTYLELERYLDAIDFAYHQLRAHFSEERAHGQYLWLMLQYGRKAGIADANTIVNEHSAVLLENLVTGSTRWVVAESRKPDPARNEVACSNPIVQALIGKRVGDVLDLLGPSIQTQHERIVEIRPKYVRLTQDVMANFQNRFPGAGTIQSLHLGSEGTFDPAPLIENLRARREHVDDGISFYSNNLCSLHALASRLGVNEREMLRSLINCDDWFVRCVECSPESYTKTASAGIGTNKVVVDLSTILTIEQLDAWDYLDTQWEVFVSRATFDQLAEWLHDARSGVKPDKYSFLTDDGRMIFRDVSADQREREAIALERLVTKVSSRAGIRSSMSLAHLDPKTRDLYTQVFGFGTLETLSVARDESAILWTDDFLVAVVGEVDFGVKRAWSQLMFKVLEEAGRIDRAAYSIVTAKLAAWNYVATIWNPDDVITAGCLSDWNVSEWPLRQCIKLIGTCPLPLPARARLAMQVLRLLRRSACVELKQSAWPATQDLIHVV